MKTITIINGGRPKAILYTALFAACAVLAPTAAAQCSNMSPRGSVAWLDELPPVGPGQAPTPLAKAPSRAQGGNASVVGLWKTTFTSGGQVVDQAFEAFHSDGTEIMVDTSAPASDNVCIGVWARTDGLTFKLNHPSWTFDKGNLDGTAAIKMDLTIDPNGNSFIGTFTVDVFDLSGNTLLHLAGSVAGKRVTVD